jgi:hypothetical protein
MLGDLTVGGSVTSVGVSSNGGGVFWLGGSGKVSLNGGGSGVTSFGSVQSFQNDGTTPAILSLQPSGGDVAVTANLGVGGNITCVDVTATSDLNVAGISTLGESINIIGNDITNSGSDVSLPVFGFRAFPPEVVPPQSATLGFQIATLNNILNSNGAHTIAFSICLPANPTNFNTKQGYFSAIYAIHSRAENTGPAPIQITAQASAITFSISGGPPFVGTFTPMIFDTQAGVFSLTQLN